MAENTPLNNPSEPAVGQEVSPFVRRKWDRVFWFRSGGILFALLMMFAIVAAFFGTTPEYSWFSTSDILIWVAAPLGLVALLFGLMLLRVRRGVA